MLNNLNLVFLFMSLVGTTISVSSMNWFSAWMGLELNMLSFIPLIINNDNNLSNEAAMKYFLIQASASSILIFMSIYNSYYNFMYFLFNSTIYMNMIILPLMMKLGATPFHKWFMITMQGLNWTPSYLLMTLQKIAPLFLMNFLFQKSLIILWFGLLSAIFSSIAALNQTSLNKILAFSSINHLGWMLTANFLNKFTLMVYLIFYMFLNLFMMSFLFNKTIYFFNQIIFNSNYLSWSISMMSLAGLPPLIGFAPKWMIIQMLILNGFYFSCFILISTALITLIFYLRLIISSLIFFSSFPSWSIKFFNKNSSIFESTLMLISCLGLILFSLFLT